LILFLFQICFSFFAGPQDKLAEALIFTCELRTVFLVKGCILSALGVFLKCIVSRNCGAVLADASYLAGGATQTWCGAGRENWKYYISGFRKRQNG